MIRLTVTSPEDYQKEFYKAIGLTRVPFVADGEAWENPDVGFVHDFGSMKSVHCGIGSYTVPVDMAVQYDYDFSYVHFGIIYRGVTYKVVDGTEFAGPAPSAFVALETSPSGMNRWRLGQQVRGTEVSICTNYLCQQILPFLGLAPTCLDYLVPNVRYTNTPDKLTQVVKRVEDLLCSRQMTTSLLASLAAQYVASLALLDVRTELLAEHKPTSQRVSVGRRSIVISADDFQKIETAHRYLESDAKHFPNAALLARELGISEQKLKAGFSHRYHQTLWDFANTVRMSRAAQLLRDSALSVGSIGAEVGYRSESAFITMFQKWSGLSPSRYRSDSRAGVLSERAY